MWVLTYVGVDSYAVYVGFTATLFMWDLQLRCLCGIYSYAVYVGFTATLFLEKHQL
jgi:hypothetical protein